MIKKSIHRLLAGAGYKLARLHHEQPENPLDGNSMHGGLCRLAKAGTAPRTILDVGAASAGWASMAASVFPEAGFILFEPLEERRAELQAFCAKGPNRSAVHAAVGANTGTVSFYVQEDLDGSGIHVGQDSTARTVPLTSVDTEVQRLAMQGPYLLKIDIHGHELDLLAGARKTLKDCCAVIIECYPLPWAEPVMSFWKMCTVMEELGFRPFDIVDPLRRTGDHMLHQIDILFVPASHPSIAQLGYLGAAKPE